MVNQNCWENKRGRACETWNKNVTEPLQKIHPVTAINLDILG